MVVDFYNSFGSFIIYHDYAFLPSNVTFVKLTAVLSATLPSLQY